MNLQPGEWVRIRPADQITATLGPDGRNFGLSFEPEMSRYIGGVYQVEFPVKSIILEETGQMAKLNRTVALKGLSCRGICAKNCPRANTLYWRESWLERRGRGRGGHLSAARPEASKDAAVGARFETRCAAITMTGWSFVKRQLRHPDEAEARLEGRRGG